MLVEANAFYSTRKGCTQSVCSTMFLAALEVESTYHRDDEENDQLQTDRVFTKSATRQKNHRQCLLTATMTTTMMMLRTLR